MEERIAAPHVARLIGIKTHTLAKGRCLGKRPAWLDSSLAYGRDDDRLRNALQPNQARERRRE